MRTTKSHRELTPQELRRVVDPASLAFATTEDVPPLIKTIGQQRAFDAISFGIGTRTQGFNLYVAGQPGSGRETTVLEYVQGIAASRPVPRDWIYLHNFAEPDRPIAVDLPPGTARAFAAAMKSLVAAMQKEIPRAFEAEEVQRRRDSLVSGANEQKTALLAELKAFANQHEFDLEMTPTGMVSFATINGKPIEKEAFDLLPDTARSRIEMNGAAVQERVAASMRQFRALDKALAEAMQQLERGVIDYVTAHLFDEVLETYRTDTRLLSFLEQVRSDVPDHILDFRPQAPIENAAGAEMLALQRSERLGRYEVNVFVDNAERAGAPVIMERSPSFANLLGRVDYRAVFGTMVTDFRQIKAGSLQQANGGFLILQALDLLRSPLAWDNLKRALQCREIGVENLADQIATLPTARLRPQPIPLDIKIVLIGSPTIYGLLYQVDEDFAELFSVRVDFAPDMPWSDDHLADYAAFVSRHVRTNGLRHLDAGAVSRVIEEGSRLREHQQKLTARFLEIGNLVTEASYWAEQANHPVVTADDVEQAVQKRRLRENLIEERLQEQTTEGTVQIDCAGERIGQVNGLAVLNAGGYAFGRPSRVSARVSAGRGGIHSIEREIELSGPIHSKGFLILTGYLQGQYGADAPVTLSATITFEQTYEGIDGDSASSTELYALLSALSGLPLRQEIAVTGSVNQYGDVQAIGGANYKIEGFYRLCAARGLTGSQGVMIPATNARHLMLDREVVAAVSRGEFHIWPIATIDEGISLLTGKPAGVLGVRGKFPAGSVHRLVNDRLQAFRDAAEASGVNGERQPEKSRRKS